MRCFIVFAFLAAFIALALAGPLDLIENLQKADTKIIQKGDLNSAKTGVGISQVQVAANAAGDLLDLSDGGGVLKYVQKITG